MQVKPIDTYENTDESCAMTPEEAAWSAGLFDGEGCISIGMQGAGKWTLVRLLLGMTDEDTVRRFHRTLGFGSISTAQGRGKPMYRWQGGLTLSRLPDIEAAWGPWLSARRNAKLAEARAALEAAASTPRAAPYTHTRIGATSARAAMRNRR